MSNVDAFTAATIVFIVTLFLGLIVHGMIEDESDDDKYIGGRK